MYCAHCSNLIDDDAKFCPYCGVSNIPAAAAGTRRAAEARRQQGSLPVDAARTQLTGDWQDQQPQRVQAAQGAVPTRRAGASAWSDMAVPAQSVAPAYDDSPSARGAKRHGSVRPAVIAILSCLVALAIAVVAYLDHFTKTFVADDALMGYLTVALKPEEGEFSEDLAFVARGDGTLDVTYHSWRFIATPVRDGEWQGSARYRLEDISLSNGEKIEGLAATIAVPLGASKGAREGVWAICFQDDREGSEFLRSEIATVFEDGTADYQILKDENVFESEWQPRDETNQTWIELDNGLFRFETTKSGYCREVRFPS